MVHQQTNLGPLSGKISDSLGEPELADDQQLFISNRHRFSAGACQLRQNQCGQRVILCIDSSQNMYDSDNKGKRGEPFSSPIGL